MKNKDRFSKDIEVEFKLTVPDLFYSKVNHFNASIVKDFASQSLKFNLDINIIVPDGFKFVDYKFLDYLKDCVRSGLYLFSSEKDDKDE